MSEKKSWDIQPSRRVQRPAPQSREEMRPARPAQQASPRRMPAPIRETAAGPAVRRSSVSKVKVTRDALARKTRQPSDDPTSARRAERSHESLKTKRARARKRANIFFSILFVLIIAGAITCFWLPAFRIQDIHVSGTESQGMQTLATTELSGSLDYVVPKNSIFFFRQQDLRTQILEKYPDISAVSISRTSFSSIAITSIARDSAFIWCGTTYKTTSSINDSGATLLSSTTASNNFNAGASRGDAPRVVTAVERVQVQQHLIRYQFLLARTPSRLVITLTRKDLFFRRFLLQMFLLIRCAYTERLVLQVFHQSVRILQTQQLYPPHCNL